MGLLLAILLAQAQPPPPAPEPAKADRPPLSREDRELVKELALLEKLELLKNLELFEEDKDDGKAPEPPQRQP